MSENENTDRENWVWIHIPRDDWEILLETLRLDSVSAAFDKELRASIKRALNNREEITEDQVSAIWAVCMESGSQKVTKTGLRRTRKALRALCLSDNDVIRMEQLLEFRDGNGDFYPKFEGAVGKLKSEKK